MNNSAKIETLTDSELLAVLKELSIKENQTTVEILFHLAELDKRRLYLEHGFSSLFAYCVSGPLKYSEGAAQRRIATARLIARYPELVELLLSRELSISTLSIVASIIDDDNKEEIITAVAGKSRREVDLFVAGFRPRKVLREVIKPVAVCTAGVVGAPKKEALQNETQLSLIVDKTTQRTSDGGGEYKNLAEPILEKRYQLSFSVSEEVCEKLEKAKKLLSGKYPKGARLEEVLEDALEALLDKRCPDRRIARRVKRRQKVTPVKTPVKQTRPIKRQIPQGIRDQVFQRDKSCAYLSPDGRRCGSKHDLEVHHLRPFAKGGDHSLENLSLRCREHNCYQAKQDFGQAFMAKYVREAEVNYGRVQLFPPEKGTSDKMEIYLKCFERVLPVLKLIDVPL